MKLCRDCQHQVSEQAAICPHCGAPHPAQAAWDGWGWEYKSAARIGQWPILHISFKYRQNRMPVPAKGIIAIGQLGVGVVTISQFSVGLFSLSQFTVAGFAVAQFALAYACLAQFGIYIERGGGQVVKSVAEILGFL